MIPEERLRVAAEASYERYVDVLLSSIDADAPHEFSPEFEAKIEKLKRNIGKKSPRRVLQKVASFILAVFACASVWLGVDAEARAKVLGWVKGVYNDLFVYQYRNEIEKDVASEYEYRPTWIPDGYTEWYADLESERILIIYANEKGQMLKFKYVQNPTNVNWMIDYSQAEKFSATVNGNQADVLISKVPESSNSILWTLPDNTAFHIGAFLDMEELIKIAESVQPMEN